MTTIDDTRNTLADGLWQLLQTRRSVRGFRPDPVPEAILHRVFTMAGAAPSGCNAQPWVVHVVSGEAAERLRTRLYETASDGAPADPDYPLTGPYPAGYRERQIDAAKALFAATGVGRDDRPARIASLLRNFRFFDAPHAAFIMMPEWAMMREAADCGMYTQSLLLALTAHGIGSCVQGALGHYAGVVRETLGVTPGIRILFGIAFGYEDEAHPANEARVARAALADTTIFHS